ncbi:tandem-95 repeat protein [Teredinibacter turnerae]|uniref:tandem-95 repeat protein n=1 Tax=Teredinibacter turnerae TaxID=2426 RepID=UPI0030D0116F
MSFVKSSVRYVCSLIAGFAVLPVLAAPPSVSIGFSPSTIGPGATSTLTYTFNNSGNVASASNIVLNDTLPAGMTIKGPIRLNENCLGVITNAPENGDTIAFSGFRLAGGASCSMSLDVTTSSAGSFNFESGGITSSEGSSGTTNSTLTVDAARPGFSAVFTPSEIAEGGISRLIFTVDNTLNGSNTLLLSLTTSLPAGLMFTANPEVASTCTQAFPPTVQALPGTNSLTHSLGGVAAGASCTISANVTAASPGNYDYLSGQLSQNGANPSGPASARLRVVKPFLKATLPELLAAGETATITYTIKNAERVSSATDISFTHDLNSAISGLVVSGLPANGFCGPGSTSSGSSMLTVAGASVPPEEECTFDVEVSVPTNVASGSYSTTTSAVNLTLDNPTTKPAASGTLVVQAAPLLDLSFLQSSVAAGEVVNARFTLTNTSTANTATGINFTLPYSTVLPSLALSQLPATGSCGAGSTFSLSYDSARDESSVLMSGGTLAAGADCTFDVGFVLQDSALPGAYTFTSSYISATINGAIRYSGRSSSVLSVYAAPLLSIATDKDIFEPGETADLHFKLRHGNAATASASGIQFSLDLDQALTGLAASGLPLNDICGTGSGITGTSVLTFASGLLSAGESCEFTVAVVIPPEATPGGFTLTSSEVSALVSASSVRSPAASKTTTVSGLAFSKAFLSSSALAGGSVTLRYTIANAATGGAATNIQFSDTFSSVMSGLTASSLPTAPCGPSSTVVGTTTLVFAGGELAPSASCSFDVTLNLPANANPGSYSINSGKLQADIDSSTYEFGSAYAVLMVDQLLPVIVSSVSSPTYAASIPITIYFPRDVSGFSDTDLVVGNGSVANFTGSGATYTADIIPSSPGVVTVDLPANTVDDAENNLLKNVVAGQLAITYANEPVSLVVTTPASATSQQGASYTLAGTHTINATEVAVYRDADNDGAADSSTPLATTTVVDHQWSLVVNLDYQVDNNFVLVWQDRSTKLNHVVDVPSITETTPDYDPVISGSPSPSVQEDSAYSFTPTASDANLNQTISFSIANKPAWAAFNTTTGALTGTPVNADVGVTQNIVITVTDSSGASVSLPGFDLTVINTNDAPVLSGTPATAVVQDLTYSFTPTLLDVDVGDSHAFSISNKPAWATFNSATGTLSGAPGNQDVGSYTNIVITVTDAANSSDSLTAFSIAVINANDPPVISGTPPTAVDEDSAYFFMPVATDVDVGDSIHFEIANKPDWANFYSGNGQLQGTPENDDVGIWSGIIISAVDATGAKTSLPAFNITVTNVNDLPTLASAPARFNAQEDTLSTLGTTNLAVADVDSTSVMVLLALSVGELPAPASTSEVAISQLSSGAITLTGTIAAINTYFSSAAAIKFRGSENVFGTAAASLSVAARDTDGSPLASLATVPIDIAAVNDAPNAVADSVTTQEDTAVQILVLANDTDVDDTINPASVVATLPTNGTASVDTASGIVTYTPNADFTGTDTFTYTVHDLSGDVSAATEVTVVVSPVNDAPVAVADSASTPEDVTIDIDVLANDTDVDANDSFDLSSLTITALPAHGTASVVAGSIRYIPATNFNGSDSLSYSVTDAAGLRSNVAIVVINVTGVNDLPVAVNDAASLDEDTQVVVNVLTNDSDVDGALNLSTVQVVTAPAHGATQVDAGTGAVTYTPSANYFGNDSFAYIVKDNLGAASNIATVALTINGINDAPVANPDLVRTDEDAPIRINVAGNDVDIDGSLDLSSLQIVNPPAFGTAAVQAGGIVLYTASSNYAGLDSFSYRLKDNSGVWSAAAIVSITVESVNDEPVAENDEVTTAEDTPVIIQPLANDTDVDGSVLLSSLLVVTQPAHGNLLNNGDGSLGYTPDADFNGTDSFTYVVSDNEAAASNYGTVTITVTAVNDAPLISGTAPSTVEQDANYLFTPTATDADQDSLVFRVANLPGWAFFNTARGEITGTPANEDVGSYPNIVISVSDGVEQKSLAPFSIDVIDVNDKPEGQSDSYSVLERGAIHISAAEGVLVNDLDPDGDALSLLLVSEPSSAAAFELNDDGSFTYQHNGGPARSDQFVYQLSDGLLDSAPVTVYISIAEVNDPPIFVSTPESTVARVASEYQYPVSVNDPDSAVALTLVGGPSWLQVENSILAGTPPFDSEGSYDLVLRASDGEFDVEQAFTLDVISQDAAQLTLEPRWAGVPALLDEPLELAITIQHELGTDVNAILEVAFAGAGGSIDSVDSDCAAVSESVFECPAAMSEGSLRQYAFKLTPHAEGDIAVQLQLREVDAEKVLAAVATDVSVGKQAVSRGNIKFGLSGATAIARLDDGASGNRDFVVGTQRDMPLRLVRYKVIDNSVSELGEIDDLGETAKLLAADVDMDGLADVVAINAAGDGSAVYYGQSDGRYLPAMSDQAMPLAEEGELADVNGDGYPDLLLGGNGANIYLYLNRAGRFDLAPRIINLPVVARHFGLVSASGQADVAGRLAIATGEQLMVVGFDFAAGNLAKPGAALHTVVEKAATTSLPIEGITALHIADLDGDGDAEIIVGRAHSLDAGEVGVSIIHVTATNTMTLSSTLGNASVSQLAVADFNGDQQLDILVYNENGALQRYYATGSPGEYALMHTVIYERDAIVAAEDFNGDTMADILSYRPAQERVDIFLLGDGEVQGATGDLSLSASAAAGSAANYWINYRFTVTSQSMAAQEDVVTWTQLPEGMTVVSLPDNCEAFTTLVRCDLGDITAGADASLALVLGSDSSVEQLAVTTRAESSAYETAITDNKQQQSLSGIFTQTDVKVTKHGGGGALGWSWLMVGLLLVRRRYWALLAALLGWSGTASAGEDGSWRTHVNSLVAGKFRFEAGLAIAHSDWDRAGFQKALDEVTQESDLSVSRSLSVSSQWLVGYQLQPWLDLEAGYISLGKADLAVAAVTTDADQVSTLIAERYPVYGAGPFAGVRALYVLDETADVFFRAGLWSWQQEYDVTLGEQSRTYERSATDLLVGVGVSFNFSPRWGAAFSLSTVKMEDSVKQIVALSASYRL